MAVAVAQVLRGAQQVEPAPPRRVPKVRCGAGGTEAAAGAGLAGGSAQAATPLTRREEEAGAGQVAGLEVGEVAAQRHLVAGRAARGRARQVQEVTEVGADGAAAVVAVARVGGRLSGFGRGRQVCTLDGDEHGGGDKHNFCF